MVCGINLVKYFCPFTESNKDPAIICQDDQNCQTLDENPPIRYALIGHTYSKYIFATVHISLIQTFQVREDIILKKETCKIKKAGSIQETEREGENQPQVLQRRQNFIFTHLEILAGTQTKGQFNKRKTIYQHV